MPSKLVQELQLIGGIVDRYLAKRMAPRTRLSCNIPLEMRCEGDRAACVTVINASSEGLGIRTKERLKEGEEIELRLADSSEKPFERFVVLRVTQDILGNVVGVVPI